MRGLIVIVVLLGLASTAQAAPRTVVVDRAAVGPDTERITYRYGPLVATAGQNLNTVGPVSIERPAGDVFVTRLAPTLVGPDGMAPPVERVHMHHAVFLNMSRTDEAAPGLPQRFFGFAEEKTIATLPTGFGLRVRPTDVWALNHMLHNGTTANETVYVEYTLDVVPAASPTGRTMQEAHPLWLDVQNGRGYPVFDVKRGTGDDGRFAYPDQAATPYPDGNRRNVWRAPRDMTLIAAAGHLHPGGLWVDLFADRGARATHLFRSEARYFDPNGPVSWDLAMTATPGDWRAGVRAGDTLRVSTTYETQRASWYESMGIIFGYYVPGLPPSGDAFAAPPATRGATTHGHLPEADNHGGAEAVGAPDLATWPDMITPDRRVGIAAFRYLPGDMASPADGRGVPVVDRGESLRFGNLDASSNILHTVTACRAPCNRSTGISYPLADGDGDFDSGTLGYGPEGYTPAAQRAEWDTPKDLRPGTYTYFCRIHPFMRGAFRVKGGRGEEPGAAGGPAARRLHVLTRRLRVRRGTVRIRVVCPRGGARCRGKLELLAGRVRLGSRRFSLAPGRRTALRIRVRGTIVRVLRPRAVRLAVGQADVRRRSIAMKLRR